MTGDPMKIPIHKRRRIWRDYRDKRWLAVPKHGAREIFLDSAHGGPDAALEAAIAYRDACDGPPEVGLVNPIRYKGTTTGYAVLINRKERYILEYFGIRKHKSLEVAKRAAEEFRDRCLASFP